MQYGQFCGKDEKDKYDIDIKGVSGLEQSAYIMPGNQALEMNTNDLLITQCLAASPSNSSSMDHATQALVLPPGAASVNNSQGSSGQMGQSMNDAEMERVSQSTNAGGKSGKRPAAASQSAPPKKAPKLDIPEQGLHPGIQVVHGDLALYELSMTMTSSVVFQHAVFYDAVDV